MDKYKVLVGDDGDSGTGLQFLDINHAFPDARVLIVERPLHEVSASISGVFGACDDDTLQHFAVALERAQGMRVPFHDLNKSLPEIWEYLVGTKYDERRGRMLANMNVQVDDMTMFDIETAGTFLNAA